METRRAKVREPLASAVVLVILTVFLCPTNANTQTNGTAGDQLKREYKGKPLLLRGFYSGSDLTFDENGVVAGGPTLGPWTLANVQIADIESTPQRIEITGERLGSWFKTEKDLQKVKTGKIKIHISVPASNNDFLSTARNLLNRVFLQNDEKLCPLLPEEWQVFCAGEDPQARKFAWTKILEKNHLTPYNTELRPSTASAKLTAPHAEPHPDPSYTKEAAQHRIEGTTVLRLVIDGTGHARVITILRPLGMGLDEEAIRAVTQWKFHPSTQNGEPVPVQINVEVNFRCCPWPGI